MRRSMWICVAVAVASGWIWSVTTPWFQVPDEVVHIGYVHYFAETGKIPSPVNTSVGAIDPSPELGAAIAGVPFSYQGPPNWSKQASDQAQAAAAHAPSRPREIEAGAAANNPPLYYVLEAIPYRIFHFANLFDRILAMRLFSSLFLGFTTAFSFLFVRELLPGSPWTWTVGALAVALQPLAGAISGGVNPDALLWAACGGAFLAVARILRHGLTVRRGLGLAAALAVAILTKGASLALLPGAGLAVAIGAWRLAGTKQRRTLLALAGGAAAVGLPLAAWVAVTHALHSGAGGGGTAGTAVTGGVTVGGTDLRQEVAYVWQLYMPRLPFMNDQFIGYSPLWVIWFQGFVGRFGYFFYTVPEWFSRIGAGVAVAVLGLVARALWRWSERIRLSEFGTYLLMAVSVLAVVGVAGFQFRQRVGLPFEQTRYLFLLLPLYAALVAVAVRAAGRYGRALAIVLVAFFAAHQLFAVLFNVAVYYG
jgi:4-amino-4-deoxy-L-arabinose transferase-like glycosyltransferase